MAVAMAMYRIAGQSACPELDCLRDRLSPALIAAAEQRSAATGVGADRALIAAGIISEEAYLAALTAHLGIAFEPLDDVPRHACDPDDKRLLDAAAHGVLPLGEGDRFVVAPRNLAARNLTERVYRGAKLAPKISLTTEERLQAFVARHAAHTIARRATDA